MTRSQAYRLLRELLPRKLYTRDDLIQWLLQTQRRNEQAARSHERRRKRAVQSYNI